MSMEIPVDAVARLLVGLQDILHQPGRADVVAQHGVLHKVRDIRKRDPLLHEQLDRRLVGRVVDGRHGAAGEQRLIGKAQPGKARAVHRMERELPHLRKRQPLAREGTRSG